MKLQDRPYFLNDPRWQATKAARRALEHAQAVRESAEVTALQWRLMSKKDPARIDLYEILRTLRDKKVPFVLIGAHALGGWTGRPRATKDIDILCKSARNHARAVKAIKELCPHLEARVLHGVTAFFLPGELESVIDIAYPHREDPLKRGQDAIDFAWMVRHAQDPGQRAIDLEKLADLGEKVWPGDGGREILRLVDEANSGKLPSLDPHRPAE